MKGRKRTRGMPWEEVQRGNGEWWTAHPMAYDWHGDVTAPRLSPAWFDAIDARFLEASRPWLGAERPFERVLPYERLAGARVLEIGCGMGLHTALMARAGAEVTAIDLTEAAVTATRTRLERAGLRATVERADAEALPFPDRSFDLIWSWGAIHHAAARRALRARLAA